MVAAKTRGNLRSASTFRRPACFSRLSVCHRLQPVGFADGITHQNNYSFHKPIAGFSRASRRAFRHLSMVTHRQYRSPAEAGCHAVGDNSRSTSSSWWQTGSLLKQASALVSSSAGLHDHRSNAGFSRRFFATSLNWRTGSAPTLPDSPLQRASMPASAGTCLPPA
jgi:hypothetical protein